MNRSLLLVSSFLHPRGGDTTLLFDAWGAYEAGGIRVIPFAMRHPDNVRSDCDTRFPPWHAPREATGWPERAWVAWRSTWNLKAARALDRFLAEMSPAVRPQAAHLHHLHRHLTPSILPVLQAHGLRVVWTLHDYEWSCPTGLRFREGTSCNRCIGGQYQHAIDGRCKDGSRWASAAVAVEKWSHRYLRLDRWVNHFVAPSGELARVLIADGLPAEKVVHLPNFVRGPKHPITRGTPDAGAEPTLRSGVVFVGRLTPEKGASLLVEAACTKPIFSVEIIGDGVERRALQSAAPPNVSFAGALDRNQVAARLSRAAVAVVPSRWPENHPYAVLEAQAAGCPVIAAKIGGIPEMIEPGVDGLLVPPNDANALAQAIRSILENSALAAELSAGGLIRARKASQIRWVENMDVLLWGAQEAKTVG